MPLRHLPDDRQMLAEFPFEHRKGVRTHLDGGQVQLQVEPRQLRGELRVVGQVREHLHGQGGGASASVDQEELLLRPDAPGAAPEHAPVQHLLQGREVGEQRLGEGPELVGLEVGADVVSAHALPSSRPSSRSMVGIVPTAPAENQGSALQRAFRLRLSTSAPAPGTPPSCPPAPGRRRRSGASWRPPGSTRGSPGARSSRPRGARAPGPRRARPCGCAARSPNCSRTCSSRSRSTPSGGGRRPRRTLRRP